MKKTILGSALCYLILLLALAALLLTSGSFWALAGLCLLLLLPLASWRSISMSAGTCRRTF